MLRDRRLLLSAVCFAGAIGLYFWTGRVRRPPQPAAARLPASARVLLPPPHRDNLDLTVAPHQELDYRVGMQAGATLVYAWSTGSSGRLSGRFPDQNVGQAASYGHGAFLAQSSGWYHWRWKNPSGSPIAVHVKLNGYYELVTMPSSQMPYDK
ncbi:MAG TPA: hypothetical protein VME17_17520 [Bryobacteraceae bacterium]|nr:hypothetical protein [Bryobacteraceae bacterium]